LKEGKRAQRRFEKEKRKKKARKIYKYDGAEKLADHIANCSCSLCRNPRTSCLYKGRDKLTLQERKEIEREEENDYN